MSKMPLDWHRNNLKNIKEYLISQQRKLTQAQDDYIRTANDIAVLETQIATAEELGKDGFDSDKYLKGKKQ